MEDGVPEAESLLHPKEEDDDEKDNHQESGEERPSGSFINHIFSNLVSRGEAEHREEEGKEEENEEKGGGLLDNIIPNLISPLSKKEEQNEAFQVRDGEGTSEDQVKKKQKVTTVVDEANERVKAEEEGGGGIIDHIVSHFPTSLPGIHVLFTSPEFDGSFVLPFPSVFSSFFFLFLLNLRLVFNEFDVNSSHSN
jgi:hypothetical protein